MEFKPFEIMTAPIRTTVNGARFVMERTFGNDEAMHNAYDGLAVSRLATKIDHEILVDLRETNIGQPGIIDVRNKTIAAHEAQETI